MEIAKNNKVASVRNDFVLKASYDLSSNESKLLMYLISTIDSKSASDFDLRTVKVKDLEKFFTEKKSKWGSFYKRMDKMCKQIMSKPIMLPKGFVLNGETIQMHEYIHWFKKISPKLDKDGDISVEFYFHDDVKPFLLSLRGRFVQIDVKNEYFPFVGKHTLHLYPAFRAARSEEKARYPNSQKTILVYGVDELKNKLSVSDKYKVFGNFRTRVIQPLVDEINDKSSVINVEYELLKTGRGGRVTAIEFAITDVIKVDKPKAKAKEIVIDYVPSKEEVNQLSRAKLKAYEMLVKFGVKEGIAFKQMIPKVAGGVVDGYEDIFIKYALQHFKRWSNQQKTKDQSAGTFVNWWTKSKVFSHEQDVFWKINEKVSDYIKKQSKEKRENREDAKGISNQDFVKKYQELSKKMTD